MVKKYKKRKLIIFLADLTHAGVRIATENIPLNIGLLASYALKKFGSDVEIKLFKYPDKLFAAIRDGKYDLFAASTYIWNNNVSYLSCRFKFDRKVSNANLEKQLSCGI